MSTVAYEVATNSKTNGCFSDNLWIKYNLNNRDSFKYKDNCRRGKI